MTSWAEQLTKRGYKPHQPTGYLRPVMQYRLLACGHAVASFTAIVLNTERLLCNVCMKERAVLPGPVDPGNWSGTVR